MMPDREKVIEGLEKAVCAFHLVGYSDGEKVCNDAIALLKQEAVEPVKKDMVEITARYEFDCPCGSPLLIGQPYCADCGRSVKWE